MLNVGSTSTLLYTITNAGPAPATNAVLAIPLPVGLWAGPVLPSPSQGICTVVPGGIDCALGLIPVGGFAQVSAQVVSNANGTFSVSANTSAKEPDPKTSNNTVTVTLSVPGPATPTPKPPPSSSCSGADIALIGVTPYSRRVAITGAARLPFAGQQVDIELLATKKIVATTTIHADGTFSTSAALPPRKIRGTNKARYVAIVGAKRSPALKLYRRMYLTSAAEHGGKVLVAGHVTGSFRRGTKVRITLRTSCTTNKLVGTARLRRDGRWSATVAAPSADQSQIAVYRASTTVLSGHHTEPTFTLPHAPTV
jgi:hypothetical protein